MLEHEMNESNEINIFDTIVEDAKLREIESILKERALADLSKLNPEEQFELIDNHVATQNELPVVPDGQGLLNKLVESKKNNKPLLVKFGIDPTGSDIHIGHMVSVIMIDRFLRMGHDVVFVVGDFTAQIGDPSGRGSSRKALSEDDINKNLKTYRDQTSRVLDVEKIRYEFNSTWLKNISVTELVALLQNISANKMWQREDFQNRLDKGSSISMAELLYPIFMAEDSVEILPDVEIGGLDQYLNLMWCRELMRMSQKEPEVFVTVDLIPGTDGREDTQGRKVKMSKSLGNYIAVELEPKEMYGKIMSIPDEVMWIWLRELTELREAEIENLKSRSRQDPSSPKFLHPMDIKKTLANLIIGRFNSWGQDLIKESQQYFEKSTGLESKSQLPEEDDIEDIKYSEKLHITDIAKKLDMSSTNLRRIIDQRGSYIWDKEKQEFVNLKNQEEFLSKIKLGNVILKIGKRNYVKIQKDSDND